MSKSKGDQTQRCDELFFALLRFSLGIDPSFPHRPTAQEWWKLYVCAVRQSLVGVTFDGVSRLSEDYFSPSESEAADAQTYIPERLAMQWANDAERIAGLNDLLNRKSAQLTALFEQQGHHTAILKGQANARLYPNPLSRQTGDIDIYVDGGFDSVGATLERLGMAEGANTVSVHHFQLPLDEDDIEVEVHHMPGSGNFSPNTSSQHLLEYLAQQLDGGAAMCDLGFRIPSTVFALAMQLSHINRHVMQNGVGLRQITDYYLLLRSSTDEERRQLAGRLREFGLLHPAKALMWLLGEIFHLPKEQMMVRPDARRGKWLMQKIIDGGNFGFFEENPQGGLWQRLRGGRFGQFWRACCRAWFSPSDSGFIMDFEMRMWRRWIVSLPKRIIRKLFSLIINKTTK